VFINKVDSPCKFVMFCWQDYCAERRLRPPPKSFKPLHDNLYLCGPLYFETTYATSFTTHRVRSTASQSINQS